MIIDLLITVVCAVLMYGLVFGAMASSSYLKLRTVCGLSAAITLSVHGWFFAFCVAFNYPFWVSLLPLLFTLLLTGFAKGGMRFTWRNKNNE